MAIKKTRIIKYTLMPEILPRIGKLFGSGFSHIAATIAMVFGMVRLLPDSHPYLQSDNFGRFAIRHVVYEAARNLKFDRRHADQVVIFSTIMIGLVLLALQLGLVLLAAIAQPVLAMPYDFNAINLGNWFTLSTTHTYYPYTERNDIALILLDRVFGVRGIFNSCVSTGVNCINHDGQPLLSATGTFGYPNPLHLALHQLFRMYSIGISLIAVMIIIYYIITIIGETAVSGTPFGQRFNRVWAPVRLVLFFAMLAPLNIGGVNAGLNGAQFITLLTAKFGSNFASNAWGVFNTVTASAPYTSGDLVAIPGLPTLGNMAQFWTVAHACVHGEQALKGREIGVYLVRNSGVTTLPGPAIPPAYTTASPDALRLSDPDAPSAYLDFNLALNFTNDSPPHVVIGELNVDRFSQYKGSVEPTCGEIAFPLNATRPAGTSTMAAGTFPPTGAYVAHMYYWIYTNSYHAMCATGAGACGDISTLAQCTLDRSIGYASSNCDPTDGFGSYPELVRAHMERLDDFMRVQRNAIAVSQLNLTTTFNLTDDLVGRGWAGAAIWYNRIADVNGSIASAVFARPYVAKWPVVMENVRRQQQQHSPVVSPTMMFNPSLPNNTAVTFDENYDDILASVYYNLYTIWSDNIVIADPETALTGNAFIDTVNTVFGTQGLFNMREQPATPGIAAMHDGNQNVHPLALLSSLGRSMVEASVINLGVAAGATIGGGLLSIMEQFSTVQILLNTAASFYTKIAATTIMIGVILGYVLPFMPFVYFFFAIGGWVKSIFEAMVAMPIWALGHLRIDGHGVMGPGATNGYYLLFEIFIRPILILIGLISSVLIFGALVQILNQIFDLMVMNVGGYRSTNPTTPAEIEFYRGPIDELFYSVMYAVICYMLGISSFKMIDAVPNNILRWMGSSVSTFKELQGDTAGQLAGTVYQKGNIGVSYVTGVLEGNSGRLAAMIGGGGAR